MGWRGCPDLQLLDGLPAFANDQASLPRRDHDLLHRAILAPVGVVMELSSGGAPTTPGHNVIQHHLCLPGKEKNWVPSPRMVRAGSPTQLEEGR